MPPSWLTALAWTFLGIAFVCAGWIMFDMYVRGHRQQMAVMEAVWPITALYFGPVALAAYRAWGRPSPDRRQGGDDAPPEKPGYATTAIGVSHCGAGCTLGDVIAEFTVFGLGASVAGLALPAEYIGDYVLALVLGVLFQYFAIAPMRGLGVRRGLIEAGKADVLSLTAFEVGLFGWMALMFFVFFPAPHHLRPDSPVYWFLMQIGMIAGFFTAWPVNTWLIRKGIKEAM
ncbi:membrane protein [Streptomyces sp. TS71-3]|nr:membrane protein [Streptomyces sp. TS71-3]